MCHYLQALSSIWDAGGHYLEHKHEQNEVIIISQHSVIITHYWNESDSEKITAFSLLVRAFTHLLNLKTESSNDWFNYKSMSEKLFDISRPLLLLTL